MTAKGIVVSLGALTVLGMVAVMAALSLTAGPPVAQGQAAEPTLRPTNTPLAQSISRDAVTPAQLKKHCKDAQPNHLDAYVADAREGSGKTLSLEWWANSYHWDLPEGMSATYRIERKTHAREADGGVWQVVASVTDAETWQGPAETGHWHYQVGLVSLQSGALTRQCQTRWAESPVDILTPQEKLVEYCDLAYVTFVRATVAPASDGQGETVALEWLRRSDRYSGLTIPGEIALKYRVERMRRAPDGSEGDWQTVGELSSVEAAGIWKGTAEPGGWRYRMALVAVEAGSVTAKCEHPDWKGRAVRIPTAEERARETSDRATLIKQASSCAIDALSDNFTPDASPVIGAYIDRRVSKVAADQDFAELAAMTVMFCVDVKGDNYGRGRVPYILQTLFDSGYY